MAVLSEGRYEGNVRELGAVVMSTYLMARAEGATEIGLQHLLESVSPGLR